MSNTHQPPGAALWPLAPGQVTRLSAARDKRVLWVQAGRVWATRTGGYSAAHGRNEDHWLASGHTIELPAGSEWVIEPWPAAQVGVLVLPS